MNKVKIAALTAATCAFHFVFWKEEIGINFLLLSLFSVLMNVSSDPTIFSKREVKISVGGHAFATFFMLYHYSLISLIAAFVTWLVMLGFFQQRELRTVYGAFLSSVINFFKLPPNALFVPQDSEKKRSFRLEKVLRLIFLPLVALLLFFFIFRAANSVFRQLSDQLGQNIQWGIFHFFKNISVPRMAFFLFGFMVCNWFIYKAVYLYFGEKEKLSTDTLSRFRKKKKVQVNAFFLPFDRGLEPALKTENKIGMLMMVLISTLLVFVNFLDIVYVWFGYVASPDRNFSQEVHKGVNLLIFSILLSIFIMLYYFRNNQNFYIKNKRLKQVALFWVIQNLILIVSVIFRNAHYIAHHGYTHKRIGVYVFLIIVTLGLISLAQKIRKRKSFFYMAKFNSWSIYGMLVFLACFNWDMFIFQHNFQHRKSKAIDVTYLVDLSDEVLLTMNKNRNLLFQNQNVLDLTSRSGKYNFEKRVVAIEKKYRQDKKSLWSWNYRKARMRKLLKSE